MDTIFERRMGAKVRRLDGMRMDMMRAETLDYAAAMGKLLDSSSLQWRVPSASTPSLANTGIGQS